MNIEQHLKQIEQIADDMMKETNDPRNIPNITIAHMTTLKRHAELIGEELQAQADSAKNEGWSNYETWLCWEFFKNDDKGQFVGLIDELKVTSCNLNDIQEVLKECVTDHKPDAMIIYSDLLQTAIDRINFQEIAERLIEEAKSKDGVE